MAYPLDLASQVVEVVLHILVQIQEMVEMVEMALREEMVEMQVISRLSVKNARICAMSLEKNYWSGFMVVLAAWVEKAVHPDFRVYWLTVRPNKMGSMVHMEKMGLMVCLEKTELSISNNS